MDDYMEQVAAYEDKEGAIFHVPPAPLAIREIPSASS